MKTHRAAWWLRRLILEPLTLAGRIDNWQHPIFSHDMPHGSRQKLRTWHRLSMRPAPPNTSPSGTRKRFVWLENEGIEEVHTVRWKSRGKKNIPSSKWWVRISPNSFLCQPRIRIWRASAAIGRFNELEMDFLVSRSRTHRMPHGAG